jgi:ABC-type polysaccharide/polyol phosphate transport system ATPase subunit
VGDRAVQEKCLERMKMFRKSGKTLLFVSHSAALISELCVRALWLDHGKLVRQGNTAEVVCAYQGVAVSQGV